MMCAIVMTLVAGAVAVTSAAGLKLVEPHARTYPIGLLSALEANYGPWGGANPRGRRIDPAIIAEAARDEVTRNLSPVPGDTSLVPLDMPPLPQAAAWSGQPPTVLTANPSPSFATQPTESATSIRTSTPGATATSGAAVIPVSPTARTTKTDMPPTVAQPSAQPAATAPLLAPSTAPPPAPEQPPPALPTEDAAPPTAEPSPAAPPVDPPTNIPPTQTTPPATDTAEPAPTNPPNPSPTRGLPTPLPTPVLPTATPASSATPIPPIPTPAPTPVVPTATPAPPTVTPIPPTAIPASPTAMPTASPTAMPTVPIATPVPPTDTPVPPTDTPIPPTDTPVPPTDTPVPPTDTPVPPTDTPIPPTDTPVPPTDTPVPPTDTPVPPTDTPVPQNLFIQIVAPSNGATISGVGQTGFEAIAYDPDVATTNGAGITSVNFSVVQLSGGTYSYNRTEAIAAYCVYGGDSPCSTSPNWATMAPGTYSVTATANAPGKPSVTVSVVFTKP